MKGQTGSADCHSSEWPRDSPRTLKQVQRRLQPAHVEELLDAYRAGVAVKRLAEQLRINRTIVLNLVKRRGMRRRYPALQGAEGRRARQLYE